MKSIHVAEGMRQLEEYLASKIPDPVSVEISTYLHTPVGIGGPRPSVYIVKFIVSSIAEPGSVLVLLAENSDIDLAIKQLCLEYEHTANTTSNTPRTGI